MNTATRVAAAAATGYILGRRKRLKLAIAVGSMLAGKRLATDPRGMLRQANELIESRPELANISDQVRTTLFTAARGAAVGVVSNRINALSDSIHDRSERLTGAVSDKVLIGKGSGDEDEQAEQTEQTAEKDQDARPRRARRDDGDREGTSGEGDAERTRPRKRAAKKAPAKKAPARKAASSGGDAPARKRSAAGKKSAATKKTAGTKKSAARKTTSSRSGSGSRG